MSLDRVGRYHLPDDTLETALKRVINSGLGSELMCLSTCNRVEFIFSTSQDVDEDWISQFFGALFPEWCQEDIRASWLEIELFEGLEAVQHLFKVASSTDSMVVGEREIITQVRNAYERCEAANCTGDIIRLVVQNAIKVAKQVYTETAIATKPVSVVSLANAKLREFQIASDARFLIIGTGQTIRNMCRFLTKSGYLNFTVFNRTLSNAESLAKEIGGRAHLLKDLVSFKEGFDVIVTCTGSDKAVVTEEIYADLIGKDGSQKTVVDLAVPADFDRRISKKYKVNLIAVEHIKAIADQNLKERKKELELCHQIIDQKLVEFEELYRIRQVERAMQTVPAKVKEIRKTAMEAVFAKEIEDLDDGSKEVLDQVINYFEKKYISVPMKMAKDIILENKA